MLALMRSLTQILYLNHITTSNKINQELINTIKNYVCHHNIKRHFLLQSFIFRRSSKCYVYIRIYSSVNRQHSWSQNIILCAYDLSSGNSLNEIFCLKKYFHLISVHTTWEKTILKCNLNDSMARIFCWTKLKKYTMKPTIWNSL